MTPLPDRPGEDDFVAGWLLACKAVLAGGGAPPDPDLADAPQALRDRLRRGTGCLRALHSVWPGDATPVRPVGPPRTERFVVAGELGRGGFGVVYRAHDAVLGREVALKVPSADSLARPAGRQRFAIEAEAAARLDHPNIVTVYDTGFDGDTPYIAAEICTGPSLAEWLASHSGRVPWRDAAALTATLAIAVHHAHDRGVLHRDLKPSNVLLATPDTNPAAAPRPLPAYVPKVADFGLAKILTGDATPVTGTGLTPGTPEYMAPEQAGGAGRDVTTAADVYALGAILYELLTGRPPFRGDSPLATLDLARTTQPAPPRAGRRDLPRDLETVCLRCLEKTPAARYPSALALAEDLARVLAGDPVLARRATAAERLARLTRRHPAVAGLTGLFVAAVVTGLGMTSYLLAEARRERDRAEQTARQLLDAYDDAALLALNHQFFRSAPVGSLRDDALGQSADRFRVFAAASGDDPRGHWLRATCYHRLSDIAFARADWAGVRHFARLAADEYERVPTERPAADGPRQGTCLVLMNLALIEPDDPARARLVEQVRAGYADVIAHAIAHAPQATAGHRVRLAAFYFDLAVQADRGGDKDAARRFLDWSLAELAQADGEGLTQLSRALQETAAHQFRCQIDRHNGRPEDAVRAGEAAVAVAAAATRQWRKHFQCWAQLGGAYNEYGSALQAAERAGEAVAAWEQGYAALDAAAASCETENDRVELCNGRYMLAYNISLEHGNHKRYQPALALEWGRRARKLGDVVLTLRPDDDQACYNFGVTCYNIVDWCAATGEPIDKAAVLREGLPALERSIAIRPGVFFRREDAGEVWNKYAEVAAASGDLGTAAAASRAAVFHQAVVCLAEPTAKRAEILGGYLRRCLVLHRDLVWGRGRRVLSIR
jgi:hypothetical protein